MKAEQLRKAILQIAIQGKLVPQNPNDEPASVLLEKIRAEKQKIIKEGKIKKDKVDSVIFRGEDNRHYEKVGDNEPVCIEDGLPFEIPESWEWVRLPQIAISELGKTLDKEKNKGELCPYLCSINVQWNNINLSKIKEARFEYSELEKYRLQPGDLLICEGGEVGRSAIWNNEQEMYYQNALHRIRFLGNISPYYFLIVFECYKQMNIIDEHSKGVTIKHLVQSSLNSIYFPLPPLEEQKRIVAEIEKYEPLISEYDKLEQQKSKLDSEIYDKLKKSILQHAIQGKLVPQDETDEPASELLKRIRAEKKAQLGKKYVDSYIYKGDDNCYYEHIKGKAKDETIEVPFDLPNNWAWSKLADVIKLLTDGTHSTPKYTQNGIHFISVKDLSTGELKLNNTKFISEQEHIELSKRCKPQMGDILLTKVGTTGIPVLINIEVEFSLFVSVALIKFNHNYMLPDFFIYLLKSPLVQTQATENTRGVGNKNWVLSDIEKTMLAIPPFAEQQRIVNKINEIFARL